MKQKLKQPLFVTNPTRYLKELFEFEYCYECNGDWYDHDLIVMNLGYYGLAPFARCRIENNLRYKVRAREK